MRLLRLIFGSVEDVLGSTKFARGVRRRLKNPPRNSGVS